MTTWTRYRMTLLLCGFLVLGWLWDLALGAGVGHAAAWLGALVLVGGISLLAARGRPEPDPAPAVTNTAPQESNEMEPIRIRPARVEDYPTLIEVEVAADKLFEVAGYGKTPPPASPEDLAGATLLLAAGDPPVGYARVEVVDGQAHLEGISVRPRSMRRAIGSALVTAACDWAAGQGFDRITLCTFAEVPWNGPFYAGLGFVEFADPTPGLVELRRHETELGLDAMGRRIVMERPLTPQTALPTE